MKNEKKNFIRDYIIYSSIIVFGVALDQLTKLLAVKYLMDGSVTVIPWLIDFTYVENRGMAWGLLADQRWIFMTASVIAIVALSVFLYMRRSPNLLYGIAISAIISGGIGNMIDRTVLGYVVDFLEVTFMDFPVFNVADSFVSVGAVGLIVLLLVDIVREARSERQKKAKKDGEE